MAGDKKKQKLIQLLEQRAWNPVFKAKANKFPESDRKRLERVQRKTESQKERYHSYENAGQVRQEFQDDLHSQKARQTNADLKKLNLPRQADVADEFFQLADRLGVAPERLTRRHHKPHPPHPWHKAKPEDREKAKRNSRPRRARATKLLFRRWRRLRASGLVNMQRRWPRRNRRQALTN